MNSDLHEKIALRNIIRRTLKAAVTVAVKLALVDT